MKLVIFGLTVSSTWGNGHAALWRGLIRALAAEGHSVTFFERDVPYYAANRDLWALEQAELVLYAEWDAGRAQRAADEADVAIVTSYCPDAQAATEAMLGSRAALRVCYDMDTGVTLARLAAGERVDHIPAGGLSGFDLVLSYTGGAALRALTGELGARRAVPLYGWADPAIYRPGEAAPQYGALLSYLGTYAADRQAALERLFVAPARARAEARFVIGGAQYPADFPWSDNIYFVRHLPAAEHAAFYASSRLTLNVTRAAMAATGWCPSGRLFEAACCGVPVLTDRWEGLEDFFEPGREILVADGTEEALAALDRDKAALAAIGRRARERALAEHTAEHRARQMVAAFESALARTPA